MAANAFRRFCLTFAGAFLIGVLPFGLSYLYLRQAGEYLPAEEVVRRQQAEGAIFGSAVFDHGPLYKLQLLSERKPETVAFGSSRVLQFRERFFEGSFVNMGRAFNLPKEGQLVAERMAKVSHPKVILLGIDFWWFNPRFRAADDRVLNDLADEQYFSPQQLILPFQWLFERKLSLHRFLAIAFGREEDDANIGVMAQMLRQGFGPDGSFYYTGVITGAAPRDVRFSDTKSRIRKGEYNFAFGESPDPARIKQVLAAVDQLRKSGAQVIVFAPPFAPTIYRALVNSGKHGLVKNFVAELRARGVDIVDFQDSASTLGSTDAEFIDGFHGGDLTYAKIVKRLAELYPESLGKRVNWQVLDAAISQHKNIAFLPDPKITTKPEVDFLKLGIKKPGTKTP